MTFFCFLGVSSLLSSGMRTAAIFLFRVLAICTCCLTSAKPDGWYSWIGSCLLFEFNFCGFLCKIVFKFIFLSFKTFLDVCKLYSNV